jgi:glycosyltransferase involved in cell wall biosynthesis
MPRSVLEAAACARPLLVTDVPGPRHFVQNGVEGFIVAPESADAMADALECLARDPPLRKRMGIAARARVLSGFTEDHVRAGIEDTYAKLRALLDERRHATQGAVDISR